MGHPLKGMDPTWCTDQEFAGPWHDRLPHFRFEFSPGYGDELQSEYFVPREHALASLKALHSIASQFSPFLSACEVRTVAPDSLLLSPHAQRQVGPSGSLALHFTWLNRPSEIMSMVLPKIEQVLQPFSARPHWGKLFAMPRERLEHLYGGALAEFRALVKNYDPQGKLLNDWVKETIGFGMAGGENKTGEAASNMTGEER